MNKTRKQQLIYTICLLLLVPYSYGQKITHNLNSLDWKFRRVGDSVWHQATVPGTVYTDLLNNKLIPDPFYGDNEKQVQWVDTCDWEYEAHLPVSSLKYYRDSEIDLEFKGIDTYAKVFVNDSLAMETDNMFQTWSTDIKPYLKQFTILRVAFSSTMKESKKRAAERRYTMPGEDRVFTRKAAYQFGWDFAPRLLGCGIWSDVNVVYKKQMDASFAWSNYLVSSLTDSLAQIHLLYGVTSPDSGLSGCNLLIKCDGITIPYDLDTLMNWTNEIDVPVDIPHPVRWWCNGLGEPYLYKVKTYLYNRNHELLDSNDLNIGLRTIELVRDSDKTGNSFFFKLNGLPVFMKGANYVPPDVFLPRIIKAKYDSLVDMAAAANMNMLRVWGGGVYPDDEFYNECDRKGILVWQDYMFACGMYPANEYRFAWLDEIYENTVRPLSHACVALWCGNNEDEEGWYNWDWQKQYHYSAYDSTKIWSENQLFFNSEVKGIVDYFGGGQENYISTTPQIGWGHEEAMRYGDSHYWGVWWGMEPFEIYNKKVPRFMSEYGFQSLPDISTLEKITDTLSLSSLKLKNHQKYPTGFQTIDEYMKRDFKVPAKFEDYVYVSQLLQAEGMQTAIEAHRRAKPNCMGTLYWQFNDCWPGVTWSSIDYYGTPKALYYQAKELYNNVLISVIKENEKYNVYIISDSLQSLKDRLELKLIDFNGKVLADTSVDVTVPASSSVIYATLDKNFLDKIDTTNTVLVCSFMNRKKLFYFAKPKNLKLSKTNVAILDVRLKDNAILISTDVLAKNVYLQMKGATFNDNYFDLLPGKQKL